jgi:hypothetical protein
VITNDDVLAEIADGESSVRELKSTYRWSVKNSRHDDDLRLEVLKTVAGFLNSASGGVLLIGVEDNGRLFGIDKDGYRNADAFVLAVLGDAKNAMGSGVATYLEPSVHEIYGTAICRLECRPASQPVFLKFGNQEDLFFVRTDPMTTKMKPSESHVYIRRRWPDENQHGDPQGSSTASSYLTDMLRVLSLPTEACKALAVDVAQLVREGKLSFIINMGPSAELSTAVKQYEARLKTFREKYLTTRNVLLALSTRDSPDAQLVRTLLSRLDSVGSAVSTLTLVRDRLLKGHVTIDNLTGEAPFSTVAAATENATAAIVAILHPEPQRHIFVRGEISFTPKSASTHSHAFVFHGCVVNTGPGPTNQYKVEGEIPTSIVRQTRPTAVFDEARTTSRVTYLRYPTDSEPTQIYPGKPEAVFDVRYDLTADQLTDPKLMDERIVLRVYQPDGGYTESTKRIADMHNCYVDHNGTIYKKPA